MPADNEGYTFELSRRDLVGSGSAVVASALIAGCGNPEDPESGSNDGSGGGDGSGSGDGSGESDDTTEEDSFPSGSVIMGSATSPANINTLTYGQVEGFMIGHLCYSGLTRLDENLEIKPDLATDWESNEEATEWTFELREGAIFNRVDREATAEDVKATYEKIIDPETGSGGEGNLGDVDSIEVLDDYTVQINLEQPYADVPFVGANRWFKIVPQEILEESFDELGNNEYGSGAFNIEEMETGNFVRMVRNEDYYLTDDDGNELPYLEEMTIEVLPEPATRANQLRNADIDFLTRLAAEQYVSLEEQGQVVTESVTSGRHYPIVMRQDVEPFDDYRVVEAIKYAVNKPDFLEGANRGYGSLAVDQPLSPAHRYYVDLDDPYGPEADIEKAQELLAEAGYPDGIELDFPFYTSADFAPPMEPTAVIFQEQMQEIGINFDIENLSVDNWLADVESEANFYGSLYPFWLEDDILRLLFHSDGGWELTRWANDEFDNTIDEAVATTDEEKRQELYRRAQELILHEGSYIVPFHAPILHAYQDRIQNYVLHPVESRIPAHRFRVEE